MASAASWCASGGCMLRIASGSFALLRFVSMADLPHQSQRVPAATTPVSTGSSRTRNLSSQPTIGAGLIGVPVSVPSTLPLASCVGCRGALTKPAPMFTVSE
jgi:hypothetical protein